jgi:DNA-binding protein HU-beta
MDKQNLIREAAALANLTQQDMRKVVDAILDGITEALARGEQIDIDDFGTFAVNSRAAKLGRNPRTGDDIIIPACKVPTFKAAATIFAEREVTAEIQAPVAPVSPLVKAARKLMEREAAKEKFLMRTVASSRMDAVELRASVTDGFVVVRLTNPMVAFAEKPCADENPQVLRRVAFGADMDAAAAAFIEALNDAPSPLEIAVTELRRSACVALEGGNLLFLDDLVARALGWQDHWGSEAIEFWVAPNGHEFSDSPGFVSSEWDSKGIEVPGWTFTQTVGNVDYEVVGRTEDGREVVARSSYPALALTLAKLLAMSA